MERVAMLLPDSTKRRHEKTFGHQIKSPITIEHVQNNSTVREMPGKRGIKPEELPPAEDIKTLERRVANDEKSIEKTTRKLPKGK